MNKNNVIILAAVGTDGAIGKNNTIPWKQQEDMRRFKRLTVNNVVIMGRKTFESLGKPLPNRHNIVLTNQFYYRPEGVSVVNHAEDALRLAENLGDCTYIIGGAEIYSLFLPYADYMLLTAIDTTVKNADAFFPEFDQSLWSVTGREFIQADDNNQFDSSFLEFSKI